MVVDAADPFRDGNSKPARRLAYLVTATIALQRGENGVSAATRMNMWILQVLQTSNNAKQHIAASVRPRELVEELVGLSGILREAISRS